MTRRFEGGVWVSLPYATFALLFNEHRIVTDAPPIADWAKGRPVGHALGYFNRRFGSQFLWREL